MSAETKAALDAALAAHIQDESDDLVEGGIIVTGYACMASYVTASTIERGTTRYFTEYGENMAHHVVMGLVEHHAQRLRHELADSWDDDEE